MPLLFHKMHGLGNDFVILDARQSKLDPDPDWLRLVADRRKGIGCDQILVLRPASSTSSVAGYEVYNADGNKAGQCGNGVRCLGLLLTINDEVGERPFQLDGPAGPVELQHLGDKQFTVNMGRPEFVAGKVPIELPASDGEYQLQLNDRLVEFGAVSMGNPHAVVLMESLDEKLVDQLGSELSSHPVFPAGCNAGFVVRYSASQLELRVFERGAGATMACGSGACAAVAVLRQRGLVGEQVRVSQPGGNLMIKWPGVGDDLWMTGSATYVYQGQLSND